MADGGAALKALPANRNPTAVTGADARDSFFQAAPICAVEKGKAAARDAATPGE